jgi:hypothetical protein
MDEKQINHAELIGADSPEEVYRRVGQWIGGLTARQHLVRSIVLDLDAHLERRLHDILYGQLSRLVWGSDDKHREQLAKRVRAMSFHQAFGLIKPAFDVFDEAIARDLKEIHDLRCGPAHGDMTSLTFRGRDLVSDHQALAELYVLWWCLNKEINKFVEKTIDDAREFERVGKNVFLGRANPMEKQ